MAVKKLLIGFHDEVVRTLQASNRNLENYYSNAKYRARGVSLEYIQEDCRQLNAWNDWLHSGVLVSNVEPAQFCLNMRVCGGNIFFSNSVHFWLYQDSVYEVVGHYSGEEKKLLVLDFADKERQKFERLATKFSKEQTEHIKHERTRIPENVRVEVWRRDQGKCAGCGSREKLEYDHIVPVSRGGGNTLRNVELSCGSAAEVRATG